MQNFNVFGKKVAILGVSLEGTDSARYFVSLGAKVFCCDRRSKAQIGDRVNELEKQGVVLRLGSAYLHNLEEYNLLVRTPGMSLRLPELVTALKSGIKITSQTKLLLELAPCPIIGVTGTKGKGTTATLIAELLSNAGYRVYLGGNVGQPLLSRLPEMTPADLLVLELSSFQLEDGDCSPQVAVVLTVGSDHLANFDPLSTNFHQSQAGYVDAKKNLVRFQKAEDLCVVNADDPVANSFSKFTKAQVVRYSTTTKDSDAGVNKNYLVLKMKGMMTPIIPLTEIKLRGRHNWENILAACLVAQRYEVPVQTMQKVISSFAGLPHRLEKVATVSGITFYNDSFSTTPETAIAAIRSFTEPIILIAGGSEKGADFTKLGEAISKSPVQMAILIGDMAPKIETAIRKFSPHLKIITGLTTMKQIVTKAFSEARPGSVVLLSPAAASFGLFKNYKDRGNQFKHYAQILTPKTY